jgi:hypothetical protein
VQKRTDFVEISATHQWWNTALPIARRFAIFHAPFTVELA